MAQDEGEGKGSPSQKDDLKERIVSGVGLKRCKYTEGNITINGTNKNVICAFVRNISFKGCECLLNINLMEGIE